MINRAVGSRIHQPKMAELIAGSLRRQIVSAELQEGDALPSEPGLMAQYGVSRPTLREAFRILESEGLISIQRGARGGARVHAPDGELAAKYAGLVLQYRNTTLKDVYDARTFLEGTCAGMAAERRTRKDLARLQAVYDLIDRTDDITERITLHAHFGATVVATSASQTMVVLSAVLRSILDRSTLAAVLATADKASTVTAYRDAHVAQRRLLELIEARDAANAETHWRRHLDLAATFVLSTGVPGKSVLDLM
jgi:DNA-binding FadR family transcriptional regulator